MKLKKTLTSAVLAGLLAAGFSLPVLAANRNFSDDMKFQEPTKIQQPNYA